MIAWWKSQRLRRRALLRWALLVLPLAFLVSRIWSVDGLSTPILFSWLVCIALLPFLGIHVFLGSRIHRHKTSSSSSLTLAPVSLEKAEILKADAQVNTQSGTQSDTGADTRHSSVAAAGLDLDANLSSPEDLQPRVKTVGDAVQAQGQSDEHRARADGNQKSSTLGARARPENPPVAETNLITATSHADTAELSALTHTEATQLAETLQKDEKRLHRLVIAQQAAMNTERRAHDRSRLVARDAIKIMRDSRQAQKNAEKLARRELNKRERLEGEYRKVSTALEKTKSIIASG